MKTSEVTEKTVFLAHSSQDKQFTRRLASRLSSMGIRIWIDEAEIKIGDSLLSKIGSGISECDFLAAVLSPASIRSSWVQTELEIASTLQINGSPITVLPILIGDCQLPTYIKHKRYADFRERGRFGKSFQELVESILPFDPREEFRDLIRKAADSEFAAYKGLPRIDTKDLETVFTSDGSALARIRNLLVRHRDRNTVISNPHNPSTCEVLDVNVRSFSASKAEVTSREYWYLRWYDTTADTYVYVLNEEIRPKHTLVRSEDGSWKIDIQRYVTTTCFMD